MYHGAPRRFAIFVAFAHPPPTDQNIFIIFSTSNTTTAHTQMGLLVVGVQGHQKTLENSKTLMKIDVFVGLVVQVPGPPPFYVHHRPVTCH